MKEVHIVQQKTDIGAGYAYDIMGVYALLVDAYQERDRLNDDNDSSMAEFTVETWEVK